MASQNSRMDAKPVYEKKGGNMTNRFVPQEEKFVRDAVVLRLKDLERKAASSKSARLHKRRSR